jgi:hypothetical protein
MPWRSRDRRRRRAATGGDGRRRRNVRPVAFQTMQATVRPGSGLRCRGGQATIARPRPANRSRHRRAKCSGTTPLGPFLLRTPRLRPAIKSLPLACSALCSLLSALNSLPPISAAFKIPQHVLPPPSLRRFRRPDAYGHVLGV